LSAGAGLGVGEGVSSLFKSGAGAISGAVSGAAGGFASGYISGSLSAGLNNLTFGTNFNEGNSGLRAGAWSSLSGFVMGGVMGGIQAKAQKKNFWTGKIIKRQSNTNGGSDLLASSEFQVDLDFDPNINWGDPAGIDYWGDNIGGTHYMGEGPAGDPRVFRMNFNADPIDLIDYHTFQHDLNYWKKGISGPDGLFSRGAIGPDIDLVRGAKQVHQLAARGLTASPPIQGVSYHITPRTVNLATAARTIFLTSLGARLPLILPWPHLLTPPPY